MIRRVGNDGDFRKRVENQNGRGQKVFDILSTTQRLHKELLMYKKERVTQLKRIETMKEKGVDIHDIRKQVCAIQNLVS